MNPKLRLVLLGVVVAAVVALLVYGLYSMLSQPSGPQRKAPKISLIPMAPPPPPPPPKEEKKPEPPKEQKEEKREQLEPPKDAPPAPASQDLKMDGPAGDGPSAFSSGNITNEDLSSVGKPAPAVQAAPVTAASGLFNPFVNYGNLVKGELQRKLGRNKDIRSNAYSVEVHLWVGKNGERIRHELAKGTGDPALDAQINQAIAAIGTLSQQPPEQMPMPIRLLIATGRR